MKVLVPTFAALLVATTASAVQLSLLSPGFEEPDLDILPPEVLLSTDPLVTVFDFFPSNPWKPTGPTTNFGPGAFRIETTLFDNPEGTPDEINVSSGDQLAALSARRTDIDPITGDPSDDEPISLFQIAGDQYEAGKKYKFTLAVTKGTATDLAQPLPNDAELGIQLFYVDDQNEHIVLAEEIIFGIETTPLELTDFTVMTEIPDNSPAIGRDIGVKILPKTDNTFFLFPLATPRWNVDDARLEAIMPEIEPGGPVVPEPVGLGLLAPFIAFFVRRMRPVDDQIA